MKWEILNRLKTENRKLKTEEIVGVLLENRGLKTKKQIAEFLNPIPPEKLTAKDLGIDQKQIIKAVKRIQKAIKNKEAIIVYGDYDADGICATAILWETLYKLTKNVLPYIPERVSEGYGLNKDSLKKLKEQNTNLKLIITVDHGITAKEKIEYAKSLGIEVIICDHHEIGKKLPHCEAIVHTDKVCSAAIAWMLSREIQNDDFLDLVAIATIADLEPLLGVNRSLVKFGLKALNETKRCGLLAIFEEAGVIPGEIGTYEVGFIIAPRLNAMGRMEHALESLRLVCTPKADQAKDLASKLGQTNRERQLLTEETAKNAKKLVSNLLTTKKLGKIIFLAQENYQEGVIGLAAGKLVEEFYRPAIVVAKGEVYSKASARSINGFNIIEAIQSCSDFLVDAGGHPLAAGFTVETAKLEILKSKLESLAEKELDESKLTKTLKVDGELGVESLSLELAEKVSQLSPFGLGNPEPVFVSRGVRVIDVRTVGNDNRHLRLRVAAGAKQLALGAIGFGLGGRLREISAGKPIDLAYNLKENLWEGEKRLELKIKDFKNEI